MKGEIERRLTGSLIAFENGEACSYGLFNVQARGCARVSGAELRESAVLAAAFVRRCVVEIKTATPYGVEFEAQLPWLCARTSRQ